MKTVSHFNLVLVLALLAFTWTPLGSAQALAEPRFEDYPAPVYAGAVRPPDMSSHPEARTYRTRLRDAAKGSVNFAGEFVLATWGCGSQCLMGAVISARTGRVQFLPGTICCWLEAGENTNPIDYKVGSNLLILTGLINEEEPLARNYYVFSGGQFRLIEKRALASGGTGPGAGGGTQTVAPTCPSGFVLSGTQCVRAAAPAPSCPPGYQFSQGRCRHVAQPAPVPAPAAPAASLFPQQVQANLWGMGCLTGNVEHVVDGVWGQRSREALRRFYVLAGINFSDLEPTQAALNAMNNYSGSASCSSAAPRPPAAKPRPPVVRTKPKRPVVRKVRCSKVKFAFTRGKTCACTDNRVFTGTACVKRRQTGGGSRLPSCANAQYGICERTAFDGCKHIKASGRRKACWDKQYAACKRQVNCR